MTDPLSPRARRRAATERRIVETALSMVMECGLDALSMHKLAAAVDYTVGALYRYFPSKDALVAGLGVAVIDDLAERLTAAVADGGDGLTPVWAAAECYRRFARESPHRFGLIAQMLGDHRLLVADDALAHPVLTATFRALAPVQAALEAAPLPPGQATERVLVMFAGLQGALQLLKQARRMPDAFGDPDALARTTLRTLMIGWGAAPEAVDAAAAAAGFAGGTP